MRVSKFLGVFPLIFFFFGTQAYAQDAQKRMEISIPVFPWGFENYYLQFQYYVKPGRSWVGTVGYKGYEFAELVGRNGNYNAGRLDIGHRFYTTKISWLQLFATGNLNMEVGTISFRPETPVPSDSLQMKGLMLGPELNVGGKITILKRVTLTALVGYRYYFNTFDAGKITNNPSYWATDDWFNLSGTWEGNRDFAVNVKKGTSFVAQLNIGYVFGVRKSKRGPDMN